MKRIGLVLLTGLGILFLVRCSEEHNEEFADSGVILAAPEISALGFPRAVPHTVPYLACDFSFPCATNRGFVMLSGKTNIAFSRLWTDGNRRLCLMPRALQPGTWTITLEGFYAEDGSSVRDSSVKFEVITADPGPDTKAPSIVSQSPNDQDFSVSPSLSRILIRFDEPVDTVNLTYSLSDGGTELPCKLDTSMRMTDLVICTITQKLTPETCYIFSLYGILDAAGNSRPVHFVLFATGPANGGQGNIAEGLVEHLVISELCVGGLNGGTAFDEFIELYNPGMTPLDLSALGYRIYKSSATGSPELLCDFANPAHFARMTTPARMPAQGFYLIVNQGAAPALGDQADALVLKTRMSLAANNTIWLTRGGVPSDTASIDYVGMGQAGQHEGPVAAAQPAAGMSIERKARQDSDSTSMGPGGRDEGRGHAFDRNHNAQDFIIRTAPQPQSASSGYEDWSR